MPYSVSAPPAALKGAPKHAIEIFVAAFNAAFKEYNGDEGKSYAVAYAAMKRKFRQTSDGKWVVKSDGLLEFSITKASIDEQGVMRFSCTGTDTSEDLKGDTTSHELYQDFVKYANQYGMPWVSISHYGKDAGIPGEFTNVFEDGRCFKGKGFFYDTPLGKAAFNAVRKDRRDNLPLDKRIRISIGFYDFMHSHGDQLFVRESLSDLCPLCEQGLKERKFLRGKLEHMALTRVPQNPRTPIELEEMSMGIITRKDDASSIVGEELAAELDAREKAKVSKSETEEPELVIKAEAEVPKVEVEPAVEKTTTVVPLPSGSPTDQDAYPLPYNGAISLKEVQDYLTAKEEAWKLQDSWFMLSDVIGNIFQSAACTDKKKAVKTAIDEFKSGIEAKALVAMAQLAREDTAVDKQWETLKAAVEKAKTEHDGDAERLGAVQPALNELAQAIRSELLPVATGPVTVGPETMKAMFEEMLRPLYAQIAGLKAAPVQPSAQPIRKSLDFAAYPQLIQKSEPKSKLEADVWRSVQ